MQIQPATCPACGGSYDPLRAQAVTVIDGRVRAFCSSGCRERGLAPPAPQRPATDGQGAVSPPASSSVGRTVPTEQRVLIAAAVTALAAFVALIVAGRHSKASSATLPAAAPAPGAAPASSVPLATADGADVWLQPLASIARPAVKRDRRLFYGREGLPANECSGVRCSVEIDAAAGAIVMAVHDGVIEAVERNPAGREEGRFVRLNHRGGAIVSSYLQLDGIRQDLRPGIPIKAGEPIGTIARTSNPSTHPHFRFAMSVSSATAGAMLFIDPQPLLALWPMRRQAAMSLRAMEHAPSQRDADDE
jgi:hypothetical protein